MVLGPYKINIYCKVSPTKIIITLIFYDEPINILMKKLNLNDPELSLIYFGIEYPISESKKFKELGIKDGSKIVFIKRAYAG